MDSFLPRPDQFFFHQHKDRSFRKEPWSPTARRYANSIVDRVEGRITDLYEHPWDLEHYYPLVRHPPNAISIEEKQRREKENEPSARAEHARRLTEMMASLEEGDEYWDVGPVAKKRKREDAE